METNQTVFVESNSTLKMRTHHTSASPSAENSVGSPRRLSLGCSGLHPLLRAGLRQSLKELFLHPLSDSEASAVGPVFHGGLGDPENLAL